MKKFGFAKQILVLGCLIALQHSAGAADAILLKARQLVDSKNAAQAYDLLAPLQSQRAGESEYDYLLGIAALDSGKPTEAIFALERFLAANPHNGPARLEMARAYYMLGETRASRREFETVKRQQPPEQVNSAIQKYLGAINQIAADEGSKVRGYVELAGGHDSNANSATSTNQIAIPAFGGTIATLDPGSVRRSDNFIAPAAGIGLRHAFSAEWALNANSNIGQRFNKQYGQYDIGNIDGSAGLTWTRGVDQFTGAVQYQKIYLDRDPFRQTYGLAGQWQHNIDDQHQFTAYGQAMRLDYQGGQQIRDADRYVIGTAYSQAFPGALSPVGYVGLYGGRETPRASNVPHLGNDFAGLRLGGQVAVSPAATLVGSVSYEQRRYRGEEPGFLRDRNDRQSDVSIALLYVPALLWTIRPEISHTRNRSNIALNDFSRTQYLLTVRRDFN